MLEGYWYDASTNMNYVESYFEVVGDEVRYHVAFPYDEFASNNFTFQTNSLGGLNVENTSFEFEVTPGYTIEVSGHDAETGAPVNFNLNATNGEVQNFSGNSSYNISIPCSLTTIVTSSPGYINSDSRVLLGCVEGDYSIPFYKSTLTVNAINVISGNLIEDVEINVSKDSYFNSSIDSDGTRIYYLNNGSYEINTSKEPYGNYTTSGTMSYGENKVVNIYMSPTYSTRFLREQTGEAFNFTENQDDITCVEGLVNNTYYEIQETPNEYSCDGNFSESRVCDDGVDAISTTYSQGFLGEVAATYVNYTIPTNALNTSYLSVKGTVLPATKYNMSSYMDCFNEDILQFSYLSDRISNKLNVSCYDGSSWQLMQSLSNDGILYDQAMYWSYLVEEDNVTTCPDNIGMQVVVQVFCDDKVVTNIANSTNSDIVGIDCDYKYWLVKAQYSTTSYYRTIIPDKDIFDEDIYLLDLNQDSAIELILYINDISDKYTDGRIKLKKFVNGTKVTVMEQYLDIGNKVTLWLDQNEVYEFWSVDDDGLESYEGDLIADTAGVRYISLPKIAIQPNEENKTESVYWRYTAIKDDGSVELNYTDLTNGLNELTWNVYESQTGLLVYTQTAIVTGNHTFNTTGLSHGTSYVSELLLNHDLYGTQTVSEVRDLWQGSATIFPGWGEPGEENEYISDFIKLVIAIFVVIGVMLAFSQATAEIGMTISLVLLGIFTAFDWFKFLNVEGLVGKVMAIVLLGLGGLMAFFMWQKKAKRFE
jgi:hypothetical protein